jgi:molybdopterin-guanine dinucleotide biosynthesis protein A
MMVRMPGMLLIGAAGRNAGKTELACSLIRRLAPEHTIIGVKVATIAERGGSCPRGNTACGICSSLVTNHAVSEEINPPEGKDTARLLNAGASKVFFLRVLRSHLEEGVAGLLEILPEDALCVCESNSLRLAAEPDVFLMAREEASDAYKPSAAAVQSYADRTLVFNGSGYDMDLGGVDVVDGRWTVRRKATAVVLAGGQSRRMGQDKSSLPLCGRTMLEHIVNQLRPHFDEILISRADSAGQGPPGTRIVADKVRDSGPFMGVVSCLEASSNDLNFIIPCDQPEVDLDLVVQMLRTAEEFDGVVPMTGPSLYEPLFAVYRKSVLGPAKKLLAAGERRIVNMYPHCNIRFVSVPNDPQRIVRNLNTPADYRRFREQFEGR